MYEQFLTARYWCIYSSVWMSDEKRGYAADCTARHSIVAIHSSCELAIQ